MRCVLIFCLLCSLLAFPLEAKEEKLVVRQLVPETQSAVADEAPAGDRDPFWDLLKRRGMKGEKLEALAIDEIELEGIVRLKSGKYMVLLRSPKGKTYTASVGQKLFDGEIVKISMNKVTFRKIPPVAMPGDK